MSISGRNGVLIGVLRVHHLATEWPVHLYCTATRAQVDNHWLSRFVLEARKSSGDPYTPDSYPLATTFVLDYCGIFESEDQK